MRRFPVCGRPGGDLLPGETVYHGIQRLMNRTLTREGDPPCEWAVADLLGEWWRPGFDGALVRPAERGSWRDLRVLTNLGCGSIHTTRRTSRGPKNRKASIWSLCPNNVRAPALFPGGRASLVSLLILGSFCLGVNRALCCAPALPARRRSAF
jgi:hypothetical protein